METSGRSGGWVAALHVPADERDPSQDERAAAEGGGRGWERTATLLKHDGCAGAGKHGLHGFCEYLDACLAERLGASADC